MDKETIKKLKTYHIHKDDIQEKAIIQLGKQKIMTNQLYKYSLFDLFLSSIRFTRLHTWLIQFFLLSLTTFLITKVITNEPFISIIQSLTIAVIFSAMFFIEEIFRSFTSGMWELEQTLTYDLRQHTMLKLLVFGTADLVLIFCLAFISQGIIAVSFWKISLYLLVPFNITCIVLFSLFTIWRNKVSTVAFWMISGLVLLGVMLLASVFNIYEFEMKYWGATFIVTLLLLRFILKDMLQVKKWEAV